MMHDYTTADLDPQTRGMLDYAVKLTREPWAMQETDVQALRDLRLSDEQILSVNLITCMFSFLNRLADGLGVALPPGRTQAVSEWLTGPARDQEWLMREKV